MLSIRKTFSITIYHDNNDTGHCGTTWIADQISVRKPLIRRHCAEGDSSPGFWYWRPSWTPTSKHTARKTNTTHQTTELERYPFWKIPNVGMLWKRTWTQVPRNANPNIRRRVDLMNTPRWIQQFQVFEASRSLLVYQPPCDSWVPRSITRSANRLTFQDKQAGFQPVL